MSLLKTLFSAGNTSDDSNQYLRMQKNFYDELPHTEEEIVGNYDFHENFPYETHLLHSYGDIRKPVLANRSEAVGFDIGCGDIGCELAHREHSLFFWQCLCFVFKAAQRTPVRRPPA